MAKLMSYKSTGLGGASKSFKKGAERVDKFRESVHKYRKKQVKRKLTKEPPLYEAKQHKTYSASGAKSQKRKLEKMGYKVKTVKSGSGIFTEYSAFTDKPVPEEKYWD